MRQSINYYNIVKAIQPMCVGRCGCTGLAVTCVSVDVVVQAGCNVMQHVCEQKTEQNKVRKPNNFFYYKTYM